MYDNKNNNNKLIFELYCDIKSYKINNDIWIIEYNIKKYYEYLNYILQK